MILTPTQAATVARAMTELNNVNGLLHARLLIVGGMTVHVQEYMTSEVSIWYGDRPGNPVGESERYSDQNAFKRAYGLDL
jgi:hypothetical protein